MVPVSVGGIAQSALLTDHLLTYYRQLTDAVLTVVDVETTGSRPPAARVIEVGVVQGSLRQGMTYEADFVVKAGVPVPAMITRLTGITTAMVDGGTEADVVWSTLRSPLDEGVLTGHNLAFDYSFLQAEYQRLGQGYQRPEVQRFCTVTLSRLLLADLPSRSLPQLVQHFGFDVGRSHRALADAKACWLLAQLLLTRLAETPDTALRQQFAQQWIPLKEAAKVFDYTRAQLQQQLDARGCDRRTSRRGNRHLYRRGDLEALYTDLSIGLNSGLSTGLNSGLNPPQLSLHRVDPGPAATGNLELF